MRCLGCAKSRVASSGWVRERTAEMDSLGQSTRYVAAPNAECRTLDGSGSPDNGLILITDEF